MTRNGAGEEARRKLQDTDAARARLEAMGRELLVEGCDGGTLVALVTGQASEGAYLAAVAIDIPGDFPRVYDVAADVARLVPGWHESVSAVGAAVVMGPASADELRVALAEAMRVPAECLRTFEL